MQKKHYKAISDFLKEYSQYYDKEEINKIIKCYDITKKDTNDIPKNLYTAFNELIQIYVKLGFYEPNKDDFFHLHLNKLKENFDLNRNILEVGGGPLAIFSNLLAYEQLKLGKKEIDLYDPRLIIQSIEHPNIIPHKTSFTTDTDVSKFELLVGIYPCKATKILLETACKNNKDFYIALCGCTHYEENSYYWYTDDAPPYKDYICEIAYNLVKEYNNGKLIIDKLDDGIHNYPILYNKKIKKR